MTFPVFPGSNPSGYNLTRSLRTRASAGGYLSKAAYGSGGGITTWASWIKRGTLGVTNQILFTSTDRSDYYDWFGFNSSDQLVYWHRYNNSDATFSTSAVFRDPSAWYFIQVVIDSTQASNADRVKIYINGTQQTLTVSGTFTQNQAIRVFSSSSATNICGTSAYITSNYFDGYLAEMNLIDGQALTPSSFGSTNTLTGVWQPAPYTGSYGTNGFILDFEDNSALTTSSNVGLGKDTSGNGNYWTTNNISITSGVTYDSMTDVPTLTSETVCNYAVLNPLAKGSIVTISSGNLNAIDSVNSGDGIALSTIGVSTGKWYWEVTALNISSLVRANVGIVKNPEKFSLSTYLGDNTNGWSYYSATGVKIHNTTQTAYGASWSTNDVIGVAFDITAGTITFYKNNTSQGTAYTGLNTGDIYYPAISVAGTGSVCINFGQRPFAYTPPTGFVALNTYNLPTSTIVKGNTVMDATLYTGNGSTLAVSNASGFQPDFVWVKNRGAATSHVLQDSVRGAGKSLFSNATNAESGNAGDLITSFNSNGFTVNDTYLGGSGGGGTNGASGTYVGWQWQAGQGSSSSNTNGSITSTVSVNASAGFSVVTWTGTGANATVGHGLGVAPSFMISKARSGTGAWVLALTYSGFTYSSDYFQFDTGAKRTDGASTVWVTAPTSSVFSIGSSFGNGVTFVNYCWTPIAGYSAFGSYTGTANADGPMIYTGFKPKLIITKRTDSTSAWYLFDSARNPYNVVDGELAANTSGAEATGSSDFDFLSNGFKCRNTSAGTNASGGTYIYMAFAANPFKNSLGF